MTTTSTTPALACPDCRAPLTGTPACASCGLPLRGPDAARLWEVDTALAQLDAQRGSLLVERGRLLAALRATPTPLLEPSRRVPTAAGPSGGLRAEKREWSPQRVQNLLLALGALLLAVAATVFAAVTYDRLGVGGRAAVLLVLTGVAAAAAPRLAARGLRATAETVTAVALSLAALDAWGSRRLGLGTDLDTATWLVLVAATLAALSAGYAVATGLRLPRLASLVLAHLAALLAVVRLEPGPVAASLLLSLLAAVHLPAVAALVRRDRTDVVRDLLRAAAAGAVVAGALAVACACVAALSAEPGAPLALAVTALVAAGAVAAVGTARSAVALAALPLPLLAGAALVAAADAGADDDLLPLLAAAVALAGALVALVLGRRVRSGAAAGSLAVTAGALVAVAEPVVAGLLAPVQWLGDPWSLPAGAAARAALSPQLAWTGSAAVLGVVGLSAAAALVAARAVGREREGTALAAVGALAAALLAPLALDTGHAVAVLALLGLAAGLVVVAERTTQLVLAAAVLPAALAGCWSLADRGTSLVVLPVLAGLAGVVAARPWSPAVVGVATAATGGVAAAALAAAGAARGLSVDQVGALLLLVPAALVGAARLLGGTRRDAAQIAAGAVAAVAVALASADVGWWSWALAGSGLLALVVALDADRRLLAPVGGLLLSASSWVRLADAGVAAPEPYVVPVAVIALVLGQLRVRRAPSTRSLPAYGPGLSLLLLPSLAVAVDGTGLARPLLLGAVALGVVLAGAARRLQAPLLLGGGTLAVLALDLLAPYASAVPRWTALAAAGTVLVLVGATFEQRRRELAGLRDRYAALR